MSRALRLLAGAALLLPACADAPPPRGPMPPPGAAPETSPASAAAGAELHAPFSRLLAACVEDGRVDYAGLARRSPELDAYLAALAATDAAALDRPSALAFWVNAYNACTLRLILDHPGIGSIKDIPADERWTAERWEAGGRRTSLDAMENSILRPMGDPRIHGVLVCASRSCPDLPGEALVPARLDEQLDTACRRFLGRRDKGLSFAEDRDGLFGTDYVLRLSPIFDWFRRDFVAHDGSVLDFVLRYAPDDAVAFIRAHREDLDVEYLDYDWSLNGR